MLAAAALAALLSTAAPAQPDADEGSSAPPCFDVALVARVTKQTPGPFPDFGPNVIVMRWPWRLDLDVEQVLIGDETAKQLPVTASMHNDFRADIKHFLMFLKRDENGGYVATRIETNVVSDTRGRFVVPMEAPADAYALYPKGWVPTTYESLLRPARYTAADARWLQPPDLDEDELEELDPAWTRRRGRGAVALRGLFLEDWMRALKSQPGAVCPRD